jgi:uncharacterized protein
MPAPSAQVPQPSSFHVMLKPRGPICNLDCAYCYYLPKEQLYHASHFRMTQELLEEFTRQYIEAQRVPEVTFAWQGGEPTLMGLGFFQKAVQLQQKYTKPGMRIHNAVQTNGILLDDDWCRFFKNHNFLVGISLDGPRELHDAYRVDKGGKPTLDRVMASLLLIRKHKVDFNVLACVHAANADYPLEVYRFLRDEARTQFVQFIPVVQRDNETSFQEGHKVTERSVTARQYGQFLIGIFDEWVRRDVGRIFVQIFDVALAAWLGQSPGLCIFEETCGTALAMEHNGDLYSCDHFVEPRHKLGNIGESPLVELVGSAPQREFGQAKRNSLPQSCRECEVRFVCNGGCPKNRLLRTREGDCGPNFLCEAYKAVFAHVERPMRIMAAEVRAGRAAANVMRYLSVEEEADAERRPTHVGRNDPCPCGSDRKFKHCHGRR